MAAAGGQHPEPNLSIRLFGFFEAQIAGQPLRRLRTRKGEWLLALLVLRHDRPVERDWLAGTLWPESGQEEAYANLRNALYDLRQALGPEAARLHSSSSQTLLFDLAGAFADVVVFD